jgi:hypothetical protein
MTNVVQPEASAACPPQSRWHGGGNPIADIIVAEDSAFRALPKVLGAVQQ